MKEVNEAMRFIEREIAYCRGWNEIYELSCTYFDMLTDQHSAVLKYVSAKLQQDVACMKSKEWQNSFDQSCELMKKMTGVSKLKLFICTPIYNDQMIEIFETPQQAYSAGKHQAFYKLHTVLFNSIESLSIEASTMETADYENSKLILSGAMDLLTELSSITGFEILGGSQV